MWPNLMAEFIKRNYSSRYNSGYQMNFEKKFIFRCLYIPNRRRICLRQFSKFITRLTQRCQKSLSIRFHEFIPTCRRIVWLIIRIDGEFLSSINSINDTVLKDDARDDTRTHQIQCINADTYLTTFRCDNRDNFCWSTGVP